MNLDEQIKLMERARWTCDNHGAASVKRLMESDYAAILASLRELKRLREVEAAREELRATLGESSDD